MALNEYMSPASGDRGVPIKDDKDVNLRSAIFASCRGGGRSPIANPLGTETFGGLFSSFFPPLFRELQNVVHIHNTTSTVFFAICKPRFDSKTFSDTSLLSISRAAYLDQVLRGFSIYYKTQTAQVFKCVLFPIKSS